MDLEAAVTRLRDVADAAAGMADYGTPNERFANGKVAAYDEVLSVLASSRRSDAAREADGEPHPGDYCERSGQRALVLDVCGDEIVVYLGHDESMTQPVIWRVEDVRVTARATYSYTVQCEYDFDGCEGEFSTISADGPWSAQAEAVESQKWVQIGGVLGKDACPACAPRALRERTARARAAGESTNESEQMKCSTD